MSADINVQPKIHNIFSKLGGAMNVFLLFVLQMLMCSVFYKVVGLPSQVYNSLQINAPFDYK